MKFLLSQWLSLSIPHSMGMRVYVCVSVYMFICVHMWVPLLFLGQFHQNCLINLLKAWTFGFFRYFSFVFFSILLIFMSYFYFLISYILYIWFFCNFQDLFYILPPAHFRESSMTAWNENTFSVSYRILCIQIHISSKLPIILLKSTYFII